MLLKLATSIYTFKTIIIIIIIIKKRFIQNDNNNEVMFYKEEREVKNLKNGQEQESRTFERSKGKLEINQS